MQKFKMVADNNMVIEARRQRHIARALRGTHLSWGR